MAPGGLWKALGVSLGAGRIALGLFFWAQPVTSVRVAGLDAPTARRVDWLARMTAARDLAIGVGATRAALRPEAAGQERAVWYLAAATADLGDAVSITRGARAGRLSRLPATMAAAGAAAAVVTGVVAAVHELRSDADRTAGSTAAGRPVGR